VNWPINAQITMSFRYFSQMLVVGALAVIR
jgi:hypothetical protein